MSITPKDPRGEDRPRRKLPPLLLATLALTLALPLASSAEAQVAHLPAEAETDPVPSGGDAADDPAIWIHPTAPGRSVVIGTDKQAGLGVWDLDGQELQFLADGELNNVDLRYRFPLGGEEVALITAGERSQDIIAVYTIDPQTRRLRDVAARDIALGIGIYGSCMYRSATTGDFYFFGNSKSGEVEQWRLFDDGSGRVDAELVRSFDVGTQTEGCVADDETGYLFIGEENIAIWRYAAEPGAGTSRVLVDTVGWGSPLSPDVEGLTIYHAAGGAGYLIASSQGNSTFVVYDRMPPHTRRLVFAIDANAGLGIDGVTGTDGIAVVNLGLGARFPGGLFVAQDDSNSGAHQNFKLLGWDEIAGAASPPLVIDSTHDPGGALGSRPIPTLPRWSAALLLLAFALTAAGILRRRVEA
jgi:3-phytase